MAIYWTGGAIGGKIFACCTG